MPKNSKRAKKRRPVLIIAPYAPYVTVTLEGTLTGYLWQGGEGSKALSARVTKQAGRSVRMRSNLKAWVRQLTRDGDFDGPCRITDATVTITRAFPTDPGRTYTERSRTRYYEELTA